MKILWRNQARPSPASQYFGFRVIGFGDFDHFFYIDIDQLLSIKTCMLRNMLSSTNYTISKRKKKMGLIFPVHAIDWAGVAKILKSKGWCENKNFNPYSLWTALFKNYKQVGTGTHCRWKQCWPTFCEPHFAADCRPKNMQQKSEVRAQAVQTQFDTSKHEPGLRERCLSREHAATIFEQGTSRSNTSWRIKAGTRS